MKILKLLVLLGITVGCTSLAAAWPPPVPYIIKVNINNQAAVNFAWKTTNIPLFGKNPIVANSSAQLSGTTTEYTPQGTLLISDVNNSAFNCNVQFGMFKSSYQILSNAATGSGFTCSINNTTLLISSTGSNK